jgi:hypothetical protein
LKVISLDLQSSRQLSQPELFLERDGPGKACFVDPIPKEENPARALAIKIAFKEKVLEMRWDAQSDQVFYRLPETDSSLDSDAICIQKPKFPNSPVFLFHQNVAVGKVAVKNSLPMTGRQEAGQRCEKPPELVLGEFPEEATDLARIGNFFGQKTISGDEALLPALQVGHGKRGGDTALDKTDGTQPSPPRLGGNEEALQFVNAHLAILFDKDIPPASIRGGEGHNPNPVPALEHDLRCRRLQEATIRDRLPK